MTGTPRHSGTAPSGSNSDFSRRAMLAGTASATVAASGCIRQFRTTVNRDGIDQLSISITTVPADSDRESIQLTRAIRESLEAAGMDVSIEMKAQEEFLRTVLVNHDFDVYVANHPGGDPDSLYESLHSQYVDEAGWQNPFGFANLAFDDLLEGQRSADDEDREAAVATTLEAFAAEQPFVPICVPQEYRLARTDRFDGWDADLAPTALAYLGLEPTEEGIESLRLVHTDARLSENLNPLSVEYRDAGTITELLYDSLAVAVPHEERITGWLADDWTWTDGTMSVELREDVTFHDGERLTAEDVAFTYRFLADTTLGETDVPAPAPLFRGRVAAVDEIDVVDDGRLEFSFGVGEPAAERALSVPILPEHVWRPRSEPATASGVRVAAGTTEALVTGNVPPIGSGPFAFVDVEERDHVSFERFDEHFTRRTSVSLPEPTVERLRVAIDPRSASAIEVINGNDADVTNRPLESYVVDDVLETTPEDVGVLESPSRRFYHLGFNARKAPFSNPRFRRVVAGLIDKAWLVEDVFDGYARPTAVPVTAEWTPESLAWDGADPETPFLGTDGEVDVSAAAAAFEEAGFQHDGDHLRVRR
ncbi:ABC transporter substrate-binding protein [Natrialba swarupiae]|uniref:ABC transporter substrate-binding protein n=2 Tax=Natrialba swarupiae TaxID=2448032 RepID=A0A5D5AV21_9EURY|nr:ABC transporter substrate-binding protein [Natrialba swarupiae]